MRGTLHGLLRHSLRTGLTAIFAGFLAVVAASADEAAAGKYADIVVDAKTGKTLSQTDPDGLRFPASLTKMMTLFILFDALDNKKVTMDTKFEVSPNAASMSPSKLGIKPGDSISVRDAILSLVTLSANDVAVVIAENIAGSETAFAARMTATAKLIGMSRSQFRNASGLPNPGNVTTARDMATLGRALRDRFPQYYAFFSTRSFAWRGRVIGNHNRLLGRVEGVDGIKTGYTRASGFNLVTSVQTDNRYIVAVVLGGKSGRSRDTQMASLVEDNMAKATSGPRTAPVMLAGAAGSPPAARPIVTAAATTSPATSVLDRIIPRRKAAEEVVDAQIIPASIPAPPTVNNTTTIAKIVRENILAEGDTDDDEGAARAVRVKTVKIGAAKSVPESKPIAVVSNARAIDIKPVEVKATEMDRPKTADTTKKDDAGKSNDSGWKIQIGALPSESQALAMISKAKAAVPTVLASANSFTETVNKGSATLYRARFGGFDNRNEAQAACDKLSKNHFSCIALQ